MDEKNVPVFIKLDEYKDILDIMRVIGSKLIESKETLETIRQLKDEEDSELSNWNDNLNDVHKKLEFINEILTSPKL